VQIPKPSLQIIDLRPTLIYFGLAFLTILIGVVFRFVPLGMPIFVTQYGGSCLWAVMVYFLVAAFQPFRRPISIACIAALLAAASEFFRLYHQPALDAFRLSLAGVLLLGRVYSPWHLLDYAIGIALAALLTAPFHPKSSRK
jgi:hypothetical protein